MNAREQILGRLRANRPAGAYALPAVPRFALCQPDGLVRTFTRSLVAMGGRMVTPDDRDDLPGWINETFAPRVICSASPEVTGNRDLSSIERPQQLADVDVAVVRAVLGVAETGSVLLTETELRVNALAYLAQHLVVLLSPSLIVCGIQDAYQHAAFHSARYAVFHTGPSATADIEGVLIHGAQGVRSLTVILSD
jgi:L-lactate dehydrogenase complex protein LldG